MKFYIESLGCAKNQVDSEVMIAGLEKSGHHWVNDPEGAELIIVNTCGFINDAKEESIQTSLALKSRFPRKKIVMAGCLVERYEKDLRNDLAEIDGFAGLGRLKKIGRIAAGLSADLPPGELPEVKDSPEPDPALKRERFFSYPGSAFVKAAEGCSNCCTYCAIPIIRGKLESRSREEILAEIKNLFNKGIHEINLIAQDLASFGRDRGLSELPELLKDISALSGRFWLRLLYLHPDKFPLEILDIIAGDDRILPYFDIPFQHASDRVLPRMGRTGSKESYLALVEKIRDRLPGAVIRSTFLIGFPGETEEDFRVLLDFQENSSLDWLGVFTYSREEGTQAFVYPGRVKEAAASKRKLELEKRQTVITEKRLESFLGRKLDVLIEEPVKGENLYLGRAYLQAPDVDGLVVVNAERLEPGRVVRARIVRRNGFDLEAVPDHVS